MKIDYKKLTAEERDTLIQLMMKVGEHSWVYNKFQKVLTLDQKLDILKETDNTNIRYEIASGDYITQEVANELNRSSKYAYGIKWHLMTNKNLDLEFRKKFLTRGMINAVIKETDRRQNNRRYYRRIGMDINDVKKMLPSDIWPYVAKRFDDAKTVKDIIV